MLFIYISKSMNPRSCFYVQLTTAHNQLWLIFINQKGSAQISIYMGHFPRLFGKF